MNEKYFLKIRQTYSAKNQLQIEAIELIEKHDHKLITNISPFVYFKQIHNELSKLNILHHRCKGLEIKYHELDKEEGVLVSGMFEIPNVVVINFYKVKSQF
jgi:hypothetical protein